MNRVSIDKRLRVQPIAVTIVMVLAFAVSEGCSSQPARIHVVSDEPVDYPEPEEEYNGEYFRDDLDGNSIDSSVWQVASSRERNGQTSPDRCYVEDGVLKMIFVNDESEGFLSSAMQSRDEFHYGTWRARVKPANAARVLNAIYTIDTEGAQRRAHRLVNRNAGSFDPPVHLAHVSRSDGGSHQESARLQDARDFVERRFHVRSVVEHVVGEDEVEGARLPRQRVDAREVEAPGPLVACEGLPGRLDHHRRGFDEIDLRFGSQRLVPRPPEVPLPHPTSRIRSDFVSPAFSRSCRRPIRLAFRCVRSETRSSPKRSSANDPAAVQ